MAYLSPAQHPTLYRTGSPVPSPDAPAHIEALRAVVGASTALGWTLAYLREVIECGDLAAAEAAADRIEKAVRDILDEEGV